MEEKRKRELREQLKRSRWLVPIQFTKQELEVILGAGKTKIDEWIKSGQLISHKIDGMVFVHRDEVRRFVDRYRDVQFEVAG